MKRSLEEREIFLRASFNVEINEVETKLMKDIEEIHVQHETYVNMFHSLKNIGERFRKSKFSINLFNIEVSSELGIVSHAKLAWEMSIKTNEHVNEVTVK